MVKKMTAKKIRVSLIEQLHSKGADVDVLVDRVDDYVKLWDIKESLQESIDTDGAIIDECNNVGVMVKKPHPAINQLLAVDKQMIALAKHLELEPSKIASVEDDEM